MRNLTEQTACKLYCACYTLHPDFNPHLHFFFCLPAVSQAVISPKCKNKCFSIINMIFIFQILFIIPDTVLLRMDVCMSIERSIQSSLAVNCQYVFSVKLIYLQLFILGISMEQKFFIKIFYLSASYIAERWTRSQFGEWESNTNSNLKCSENKYENHFLSHYKENC